MRYIPLSQNKLASVDDNDWEWLNHWTWAAACYNSIWYAVRSDEAGKTIRMHNIIMDGLWVDHIDGDGLNNQRYNLRFATNSQNQMNRGKPRGDYSSDYKGVRFKGPKSWEARIQVSGTRHQLGSFPTEEEAAKAYDRAALEYFGEYGRLNFPL